jgi:hypothetical protein
MGQHQQEIVAGGALKRILLVLSVAALMAIMMVAMAAPAFAAPNTTFNCALKVSGDPVAEGLSKGQAKQFENNNLDTFCFPADQRQLEVLTGQQKQLVKEVPPGQQRKLAEGLAEEPIAGGVRQIVEEQPAEEVFPTVQRQIADGLI